MKEIHKAAKNGDIKEITKQVKHGVDIDVAAEDGCTPLHFAVFAEKEEATRTLIDLHASVNVQNNKGLTPLHLAANSGNDLILCILLENGANPNAKDNAVRISKYIHSLVIIHFFSFKFL